MSEPSMYDCYLLHHLNFMFIQVQVAQFFVEWKPVHEQSKEVTDLIKNFLGTRARVYSEKTLKVWKKKKVYETLNKSKQVRFAVE